MHGTSKGRGNHDLLQNVLPVPKCAGHATMMNNMYTNVHIHIYIYELPSIFRLAGPYEGWTSGSALGFQGCPSRVPIQDPGSSGLHEVLTVNHMKLISPPEKLKAQGASAYRSKHRCERNKPQRLRPGDGCAAIACYYGLLRLVLQEAVTSLKCIFETPRFPFNVGCQSVSITFENVSRSIAQAAVARAQPRLLTGWRAFRAGYLPHLTREQRFICIRFCSIIIIIWYFSNA